MKKILSLLLTLMLALSLCAVSLADDPNEIPGTVEIPFAGLHFVPPEAYRNPVGQIVYDGYSPLGQDAFYATWYYCAMTDEELTALYTGNTADDYVPPIAPLFYAFTLGNGMDFDILNQDLGWNTEYVHEIAKIGSWTFCLYMEPIQEFIDAIDPVYREEYISLTAQPELAVAAFTCYEPEASENPNADLIGRKFEFTTTDIDGSVVSSEDLFAQHEITMVNIWATWCGPCVGELPELQQISLRLQEKDCAVIGMLVDDDLDECKNLMAENGVTYPVIQAPANLDDLLLVEYIPTTLFISRDGTVLASPIVGAQVDEYEPTVDSLLGK